MDVLPAARSPNMPSTASGVWNTRGWLTQNPLFSGYSGTAGYQPEGDITVAVAVTYGEDSFTDTGDYGNGNVSTPIFLAIGALMTGDGATPVAS